MLLLGWMKLPEQTQFSWCLNNAQVPIVAAEAEVKLLGSKYFLSIVSKKKPTLSSLDQWGQST